MSSSPALSTSSSGVSGRAVEPTADGSLASDDAQSPRMTRIAALDSTWDEAFIRVESYLRAHQIESRIVLNRLVNEIIAAAALIRPQRPEISPVALAIEVAELRIGAWLVLAMGEGEWSDERFRARGRLALLMAEPWRRWPDQFLAPGPIPEEISAAMRAAHVQAGPELRFANMPPAPLDFPFEDSKPWQTLSRSTLMVTACSWLLIAGLLGVAWAASHGS